MWDIERQTRTLRRTLKVEGGGRWREGVECRALASQAQWGVGVNRHMHLWRVLMLWCTQVFRAEPHRRGRTRTRRHSRLGAMPWMISRSEWRRPGDSNSARLATTTEVSTVLFLREDETLEEVDPVLVRLLVNVEFVTDTGENLALHLVDFGQVNARDLRPRLVRVRVAKRWPLAVGQVVQTNKFNLLIDKLIGHHKTGDRNAKFAAWAWHRGTVLRLQAIDIV